MTQQAVLNAQKAYFAARDRHLAQPSELTRRRLEDAKRQLDRMQRLFLQSAERAAS